MEKESANTEKTTLNAKNALHQIFLRLRGTFGTEATDIWAHCYLPSSDDHDYHNSHTEYGYYDWFLIDSPKNTHVVLVFFSSKLILIFLEREFFKQRIAALKKAFEEKDCEMAKRWSPDVDDCSKIYGILLSIDDVSTNISLSGLGIIDRYIQTTKSILFGIESQKEFDSSNLSLFIPPDISELELMFSPNLIDRILAFLVWKVANPDGTTLEAQAAGKLDIFPTRN